MRSLDDVLGDRPLFFEPAPLTLRSPAGRQASYRAELVESLRGVPKVGALVIPELVDENHEGRPYFRSGDPRELARHLEEALGLPGVVNKVVAHLPSLAALGDWAEESVRRGVRHVVLVGGSSRYIPYPGPSVVEANRTCTRVFAPVGGRVGNIAIPHRAGEAHRMLAKTRSGAAFFTTQIVLDAEAAVRTIREYDTLCRTAGVSPVPVLLSVASVVDEGDAEFIEWLGADIPPGAERAILEGDEAGAAARSRTHALDVVREVRRVIAHDGLRVPLGVNVEQISQRHLAPALDMLRAFASDGA